MAPCFTAEGEGCMSTFKGIFFSFPSLFLINHSTVCVNTATNWRGIYLNPNIYGWRRPCRSDHATFTSEDAKSPLCGPPKGKEKWDYQCLAGVFHPLISAPWLTMALMRCVNAVKVVVSLEEERTFRKICAAISHHETRYSYSAVAGGTGWSCRKFLMQCCPQWM